MLVLGENKRHQLMLRINALEPLVENIMDSINSIDAENSDGEGVVQSIYNVYYGYGDIKDLPYNRYGTAEVNQFILLSEKFREDINACLKCISNTTIRVPEEVSKYINEISQIYTQYEDILKDKTI